MCCIDSSKNTAPGLFSTRLDQFSDIYPEKFEIHENRFVGTVLLPGAYISRMNNFCIISRRFMDNGIIE